MWEPITSGEFVNIAKRGLWTHGGVQFLWAERHMDSLSQGKRTIKPGLSGSLEAAALPSNKTVIWHMKTYRT